MVFIVFISLCNEDCKHMQWIDFHKCEIVSSELYPTCHKRKEKGGRGCHIFEMTCSISWYDNGFAPIELWICPNSSTNRIPGQKGWPFFRKYEPRKTGFRNNMNGLYAESLVNQNSAYESSFEISV